MKTVTLLLILLIVATGLINCGTDKPTVPGPEDYIVGHWFWISSTGGIAGVHLTPANTGNSQELFYNFDRTYQFIRNDTLLYETEYIPDSASWNNQTFFDAIHYTGSQITQFYEFSEKLDTLYLTDLVYDGFNHVYIRVR